LKLQNAFSNTDTHTLFMVLARAETLGPESPRVGQFAHQLVRFPLRLGYQRHIGGQVSKNLIHGYYLCVDAVRYIEVAVGVLAASPAQEY
jgi:hypothetical protein